MKKTMILAAFAALISLASCQKEDVIDNKGTDKNASPVFTASIAGATKTTVDLTDGNVAWEADDEITITDASSASALYEIESIDETTGKATFVIKEGESAIGAGPYTATYGTEPSTSQTYSATAGKLYMTAATEDNSFTFDVQCGLMKLNLTKTGESVKSIAVTSSTDATYTLTCDPAQSIASAKDFCIALPAGSYTKIEITNAEDVTCTLNSTNGVEVATNHIKPVTFGADKLNFSPATTGTAKATINGVETDVKWIQLWENGPKFAEYNVGTTSEKKYGAYFAWAENIASSQWGDNWRMPTADEYQALLDNCTFSSEERNGVKGYVVTGKQGTACALNSVFFPAGSGDGDDFGGLNNCGWYWSSSSISSERAWLLSFTISQSDRLVDGDWCTNRYNVRAVLNEAPAVPEGALPGKFTVNASGKQVYFSKGNLWADDFDLLHFEDNQWDSDNSYSLDHTSYFTWSSSVSLAAGPTGYGSNLFCDENHKVSVNGSSAPIYYALTKDEWKYLFRIDDSDRNVREMKYGSPTHSCNIIYCGTGGLVIYPDDYNGDPLSQYIEYTEETFPEGCVFLPGAGWRDDYTIREADHSIGFYWSSSADFEHRPYNVLFYMDGVSISDPGNKDNAFSIRLVANCE